MVRTARLIDWRVAMKYLITPIALALLLGSAPSSTSAQAVSETDMILQRASNLRIVEGDLDDALTLYRSVALSAAASRSHVAKALVEMGDTYQMMGSSEAVAVYERVLNEYTDQPDAFNRASAGMKSLALNVDSAPAGAAREHVLVMPALPPFSPIEMRTYDFSPDGRQMVFHAPATEERKAKSPGLFRELYIQDVQGSIRRPLVANPEDWQFINFPRWSPDGQKILMTASASMGGGRQLMVHELSSGETRVIDLEDYPANMSYDGLAWMPDNESLVLLSVDGYRIFGLDGKLRKHFEQDIDHMTRIGNVSPDGTRLLYQQVDDQMEDHEEMDVWTLDLETGESSAIVKADGFDGWPAWSADGSQVYYVSGAQGSRNVFRVKLGSWAAPEQVTAYKNTTVTYPLVLRDSGQLVFTLMKDNHTIMLQRTGGVENRQMVARGTNPMLAQDGKHLYYLGSEPGYTGVWVVSTDGGEPRRLLDGELPRLHGPKSLLSPDGSKIAASRYQNEVTELLVLPAEGGEPQVLYIAPGKRHLIPSWSPDSKEIAFSIDGLLLVTSASGGEPTELAEVANWESWNIEWSPDGKTLAAFAYLEGESNNHIMLINRASGQMRRLTTAEEGRYKENLAWHPDGKQISYMYYNSNDGNGSRIIDVVSGSVRDLADLPEPMWDYIGTWGPDGRYYFSATARGFGNPWSTHALNVETDTYETILQKPDRSIGLPTWSQNGQLIAWSEQEPVRQLWMMTGY
jgi:Tol biopolymer transport system component